MSITLLVSQRSTCLRRNVGAILVKDKRILCTGYNGVPQGMTHCKEAGCIREKLKVPSGERHELCRGLHAEQNTLIQAARHGISVTGSDLYCTDMPCIICIKMLLNAEIKNIYHLRTYSDPLSREMMKEANINIEQVMPEEINIQHTIEYLSGFNEMSLLQ
jgi:dCMP deaminase